MCVVMVVVYSTNSVVDKAIADLFEDEGDSHDVVMRKPSRYDDGLLDEALRVPTATGQRVCVKKPAGEEIEKVKAKAKAKAKASTMPKTTECTWGKVRIHTGTSRSYVQVWDHEVNGWKSLLSLSAGVTKDHVWICQLLFNACNEQRYTSFQDALDKAEALKEMIDMPASEDESEDVD